MKLYRTPHDTYHLITDAKKLYHLVPQGVNGHRKILITNMGKISSNGSISYGVLLVKIPAFLKNIIFCLNKKLEKHYIVNSKGLQLINEYVKNKGQLSLWGTVREIESTGYGSIAKELEILAEYTTTCKNIPISESIIKNMSSDYTQLMPFLNEVK